MVDAYFNVLSQHLLGGKEAEEIPVGIKGLRPENRRRSSKMRIGGSAKFGKMCLKQIATTQALSLS